MTLHLRPLPAQPKIKADTRALKAVRARCRKQLEDESLRILRGRP